MIFSSTLFLFMFLPLTLFVYYIIGEKYQNYWLLLVSILFFSWSQPNYLWIILLNIIINYTCAILIDDLHRLRKPILFVAILLNLAILYYFKYFNFTINSVNEFIGSNFTLSNIILPIGISFFIFQGMSYVIDVYRKDVSAQKNILKVALYIVLFPQLIAGPIVRYKDIAKEIDFRKNTISDICTGIERFIIGVSKKAILANTLAATADSIWNKGATSNTLILAWVGSIAYTLQIYFDFSGYSDMAIGLGRMFGFHFNENFNLPYTSKNISEFWRRWHISLSSWFRDYVYIPLGGNRRHVYVNLAVVFILTGVWHGASWHFIVWGIWNGVFILLERYVKNKKNNTQKENKNIFNNIFLKLYTLFVINIGWVLFRAPSVKDSIRFLEIMFGIMKSNLTGYTALWYLDKWTLFVMILAIIFSSSIPTKIIHFSAVYINDKMLIITKYMTLLLLLYFSIIRIVSGTYNPFIYFQF